MTQQTKRPNLLPYLLVLLVLVGVYGFMNKPVEAEPSYAEVRELFESEQVSAFTVTDTTLRMKLREPIDGKTELKKDLFSVTLFYDDLGELIEQQKADGIIEDYDFTADHSINYVAMFAPYILAVLGIFAIWYFLSVRSAGGGGGDRMAKFGTASFKTGGDNKRPTTFSDVAGADEEKEELQEIVDFLKAPGKFIDLGARIPKGVLLVGPPGTGKTSIAQSIAAATNRKLVRISLGGVHDEAEIRGHRRTYIGSMPGRIISGIIQAGSCNPLMVLDEIDKLASDYRGDPSAALLEAFDGEQNGSFRDNFLELPFDLSGVFFITTANTTDTIPRALLDRMEVIELPSYTDEEKLQIAKQHLIPKQRRKHGLKASQLKLDDGAVREIIASYTRESGVRNLEREIANICRKTAGGIAEEKFKSVSLRAGGVAELLGPAKFKPEAMRRRDEVGLVRGLAYTSVGGEVLDVEAAVVDGTGRLELTGNLGDVMKESAKAAVTYIRSRARALGIDPDFYKNKDIHIHFPEGAVPKDGPSAGITVTVALISALSGLPVRRDVAMTGEITLRGRVLPIGGLREKTMGALRAGVKTVIIPADNESDLENIDQTVRGKLSFLTAENVDSILEFVLVRPAKKETPLQPSIPLQSQELCGTVRQ